MLYKIYLQMGFIRAAWNYNLFIYFLSQIPMIGRFIPSSAYKKYKAKRSTGLVLSALHLLVDIVTKPLYIYLLFTIILSQVGKLYPNWPTAPFALHVHFFMNVILGSIQNHGLSVKSTGLNYVYIRYLKIHPKSYFVLRMLRAYILYLIGMLLALRMFLTIAGVKYESLVVLLTHTISLRLLVDLFIMRYFERKNKTMLPKAITILTILSLIGLGIGLPFVQLVSIDAFTRPWTVIFSIAIGVTSIWRIWKTKDRSFNRLAQYESDAMSGLGTIMEEVRINAGVLSEKDLMMTLTPRIEGKRGYEYLHAIFFRRYQKIYAKKVRRRMLAVVGAAVALSIALIFFLEPSGRNKIFQVLGKNAGNWFFLAYTLSEKEKYTTSLFNNIDRFLLPFPYYRKASSVLECYWIRLKQVMVINLAPIITIVFSLGIIILWQGQDIRLWIKPSLFLIIMSVFFNVHFLTLYYLLQPFTKQTKNKSLLYSAVNLIVYMMSWRLLELGEIMSGFLTLILAITMIYTGIALLLVRWKGPKTFRLKLDE